MKRLTKIILISTCMILSIQQTSHAKAYFAPKDEMIQKADVIVIAEILKVEDTEIKGETWTYKQKATAKVIRTLKGNVSQEIFLYGIENLICARCTFMEGKYLFFLKKDKNLLAGSNWHLSMRPIKGKKVEWYKRNGDNLSEFIYLPLSEVTKEIESKVQQ